MSKERAKDPICRPRALKSEKYRKSRAHCAACSPWPQRRFADLSTSTFPKGITGGKVNSFYGQRFDDLSDGDSARTMRSASHPRPTSAALRRASRRVLSSPAHRTAQKAPPPATSPRSHPLGIAATSRSPLTSHFDRSPSNCQGTDTASMAQNGGATRFAGYTSPSIPRGRRRRWGGSCTVAPTTGGNFSGNVLIRISLTAVGQTFLSAKEISTTMADRNVCPTERAVANLPRMVRNAG